MPSGLKMILSVIAGLFVGGASLAVIEMIGHSLLNKSSMFVVAAIALGVAGFFGGLTTALLTKKSQPAYVVGLFLAGLSLVNVFSFKHPVWFVPVAFILLALGTWFAASRAPSKQA